MTTPETIKYRALVDEAKTFVAGNEPCHNEHRERYHNRYIMHLTYQHGTFEIPHLTVDQLEAIAVGVLQRAPRNTSHW